jgi:hypothetical protein
MVARTMPSAMDNVSFQYVIFSFFSKNVGRVFTDTRLAALAPYGCSKNVTDVLTSDQSPKLDLYFHLFLVLRLLPYSARVTAGGTQSKFNAAGFALYILKHR